jgi:hypothetical protein
MDFYQADAYLEKAYLYLAAYGVSLDADQRHHASVGLGKARALMNQMGYYRRRRQVGELETMLHRVVPH